MPTKPTLRKPTKPSVDWLATSNCTTPLFTNYDDDYGRPDIFIDDFGSRIWNCKHKSTQHKDSYMEYPNLTINIVETIWTLVLNDGNNIDTIWRQQNKTSAAASMDATFFHSEHRVAYSNRLQRMEETVQRITYCKCGRSRGTWIRAIGSKLRQAIDTPIDGNQWKRTCGWFGSSRNLQTAIFRRRKDAPSPDTTKTNQAICGLACNIQLYNAALHEQQRRLWTTRHLHRRLR